MPRNSLEFHQILLQPWFAAVIVFISTFFHYADMSQPHFMIHIYIERECWLNCLGVKRPTLMLFSLWECLWNAPVFSLVLPAFYDTISLGSILVTTSRFPTGNREAELKPTTFSLLLLFRVFLFFLTPQRYSAFECCLLEVLNIYIIY